MFKDVYKVIKFGFIFDSLSFCLAYFTALDLHLVTNVTTILKFIMAIINTTATTMVTIFFIITVNLAYYLLM